MDEPPVKLEIRTIRTADDDLTALTSKVFPIGVNAPGKRNDTKKAIVTLVDGQSIDITSGI